MTASEISSRILTRIDDSASQSVAADQNGGAVPPEILAAINEGQELAVFLTLCLESTATFTLTAGQPFYSIRAQLADYMVPLRIVGAGGRVRPATLTELDALNGAWQATNDDPERYVALGFNFLVITPQSSGTVQFTYARSPLQMVADDFPEIPETYHRCLIDYGLYRVKLKEGAQSLERAMVHLNRFLDEMTGLGNYVRARSKASQYDVTPFELQLFDRSRLVESIVKEKRKWKKG